MSDRPFPVPGPAAPPPMRRPRCASMHPSRSHRCMKRADHGGVHVWWGGGREAFESLEWLDVPGPDAPRVLTVEQETEALRAIDMLVEFAYEQGFHELGYPPNEDIRQHIAALRNELDRLRAQNDALATDITNVAKRHSVLFDELSRLRAQGAAPAAPDTETEFTRWFVSNYPPRTIITNPEWHAPKIWRAARAAASPPLSSVPPAPDTLTREPL